MTITISGIEDVKRTLLELAPNEATNIMRATVVDLAKGMSADAKANAPSDDGDLKGGIGHKRARGSRDVLKAEVVANTNRKSFYWRFREYGQGPDGREDAMFLKALQATKAEIQSRYLEVYADKLTSAMARKARKAAKAAKV